MRSIEKLAEQVNEQRQRAAIGPNIRREVRSILDPIEADWQRLQQPHADHQFLSRHLRDARAAYRNGDREQPLCECNNPECPLKRGELPARIRGSDDILSAIYEYQDGHPQAVVLLEAREALAETRGEIRSALREALDVLEVLDESTKTLADLGRSGDPENAPATAANTEAVPEETDAG